jgi:hypothetical protein
VEPVGGKKMDESDRQHELMYEKERNGVLHKFEEVLQVEFNP